MTSPVAENGATTVGRVKAHLAITDDRDNATIQLVVDAVNDQVVQWCGPPSILNAAGDALDYRPKYQQGATMLAARVYRRRNSPNGVEDYGSELQGAIYTRSTDPDVAQMLELGRYERPAVG
jgi:hypothetical protein